MPETRPSSAATPPFWLAAPGVLIVGLSLLMPVVQAAPLVEMLLVIDPKMDSSPTDALSAAGQDPLIVVGRAQLKSGTWEAVLWTEQPGNAFARTDLSTTGTESAATDVSCDSGGTCLAGGTRRDAAGLPQPVAWSNASGTWIEETLPAVQEGGINAAVHRLSRAAFAGWTRETGGDEKSSCWVRVAQGWALEPLPDLVAGQPSEAKDVLVGDDGLFDVFGVALDAAGLRHPVVWEENTAGGFGPPVLLAIPEGYDEAEADKASPKLQQGCAGGKASDGSGNEVGVHWLRQTPIEFGPPVLLEPVVGFARSRVQGVGRVTEDLGVFQLVGTSFSADSSAGVATLWEVDLSTGAVVPYDFNDLVTNLGPGDTVVRQAVHISDGDPDRPIVVGRAYSSAEPMIDFRPAVFHPVGALDVVEIEGGSPQDRARIGAISPNPFRSRAWIPFDLTTPTEMQLSIYDASGRLVRIVARGLYSAGSHRVPWNGRSESGRTVSAGIYFAQLRTATELMTRRITLIR